MFQLSLCSYCTWSILQYEDEYLVVRDDSSPKCCIYKTLSCSSTQLLTKVSKSCSWWDAVSMYHEINQLCQFYVIYHPRFLHPPPYKSNFYQLANESPAIFYIICNHYEGVRETGGNILLYW